MKSNDSIPADEMLLAEAIAAAKARGLGHTVGTAFSDDNGYTVDRSMAKRCCAVGALLLVERVELKPETYIAEPPLQSVHIGNDRRYDWSTRTIDGGESLGWAFRCAMTQEEP